MLCKVTLNLKIKTKISNAQNSKWYLKLSNKEIKSRILHNT